MSVVLWEYFSSEVVGCWEFLSAEVEDRGLTKARLEDLKGFLL